MWKLLKIPIDDVLVSMEKLAMAHSPKRALIITTIALVATWFIYVPIHELLHVAGCVIPGGTVSQLELSPMYGAALLKPFFPFITSGSDYAGRLSGFDTQGSDLIYLSTCFAPFLLSIVPGVLLLRWCSRKPRPVLLGMGVVIGLAPFYNLIGDYYEMGSIITTRIYTEIVPTSPADQATAHQGQAPDTSKITEQPSVDLASGSIAYVKLRSDDIFKLIADVIKRPKELNLHGPSDIAIGILIIMISMGVAVWLAFFTYLLGDRVARVIVGPSLPLTPISPAD